MESTEPNVVTGAFRYTGRYIAQLLPSIGTRLLFAPASQPDLN